MDGGLTIQKRHLIFLKCGQYSTVQKYRRRVHQHIRQLNNRQHAMQASKYPQGPREVFTRRTAISDSLHFSDKGSGLRTVGLFHSARSKVFFNDGAKVFEVR